MSDAPIQTTKPAALQPMEMIQTAFQRAIEDGGAQALAVAKEILVQMEKQRDYESRDRFNTSLLRIQRAIKPIVKSGKGEKPGQRYALIEDIDAALNPLLEQEGMTLSFEPSISEKPHVIVVCAVLAQGAYERRYPLEMPADGTGPKGVPVMTRTHATGSAMTYAKRYLKNFIFDLQFRQPDDDGNRAGGASRQVGVLDERDAIRFLDNIKEANTADELKKCFNAGNAAAADIGDTNNVLIFERAKNDRFRQLKKEGKA